MSRRESKPTGDFAELGANSVAAANGNPASIDELAATWTPRLRAMARHHGARGVEVDEIAQDALLVLLASAAHFRPEMQLAPWMSTIVRHRLLTLRRSARRLARLHEIDSRAVDRAKTQRDATDAARGREVVEAVRRAIDQLPSHYSECLRMHLFDGLTPVEIAARLQLRRVTVRLRLFRGLRKLRRLLPQSLALLLLAALSNRGRSQTATWVIPAAAGIGLLLTGVGAYTGTILVDTAPPLAAGNPSPIAPRDDTASSPLADSRERHLATAVAALTVRMRAQDGSPLAGVGVEVTPTSGLDRRIHTLQAATGADGTVAFATTPSPHVHVRTDRGHDVTVECDRPDVEITLTSGTGMDVRGLVLDGSGRAVADAAIWLAPRDADVGAGMDVVRSGTDGRFHLRHVAAGSSITARSPAFVAPVPVLVDNRREMVFVLDRPAGIVRGRVVDADDEPIADAYVAVGPCADGQDSIVAPDLSPRLPPPYALRTDALGNFCSGGLPPGRWPLVARKHGFASLRLEVVIDAAATASMHCHLVRSPAVRGRVLTTQGEPVADARIYVRCDDAHASCDLTTDVSGRFECSVLPRGSAWLTIRAMNCPPVERILEVADDAVDVDLRVDPLPELAGSVLREDGTPLTGWMVAVPSPSDGSVDIEAFGSTVDASGKVTLHVARGARLETMIVKRRDAPLWTRVGDLVAALPDARFTLNLPSVRLPDAQLTLRLRDARGMPIAAAAVTTQIDGRDIGLGTTDADGQLVAQALPDGDYDLRTVAPNPDQPALVLPRIHLAPGEQRVASFRVSDTGRLHYRLWREDGSSLHSPIVWLERRGSHHRCVELHGAAGEQVLSPGHYTAHVIGDDFVWSGGSFEVRAGQVALLELPLRAACKRMLSLANIPAELRGAKLSGTLTEVASGEVLYKFEVPLDAAAPLPLRSYLPAGRMRLDARASNGRAVRAEFELPAEETELRPRSLDFELLDGTTRTSR